MITISVQLDYTVHTAGVVDECATQTRPKFKLCSSLPDIAHLLGFEVRDLRSRIVACSIARYMFAASGESGRESKSAVIAGTALRVSMICLSCSISGFDGESEVEVEEASESVSSSSGCLLSRIEGEGIFCGANLV